MDLSDQGSVLLDELSDGEDKLQISSSTTETERRRPGRNRSEPRWAEPPPGLFPGGEDLLCLLAVLAIVAGAAAVCNHLTRRPIPSRDSESDDYATAYATGHITPVQNGPCADY